MAAFPKPSTSLPLAGAWRRRFGWLGGAVLGLVLLIAALLKAFDPASFAEQVRAERLDFLLPAHVVAIVALAIEVGLGAALVLGLRNRWVLGAAAALVLFFLFLTGRGAWRAMAGLPDPAGGCGCFGNLVERTPTEAFLQDLFLMVPTLAIAAWGAGSPRRPRLVAVTALVAAAAIAGLALAAPALPLDDVATRLAPGTTLAALCAGHGVDRVCLEDLAPELGHGRHLVVIGDVDDSAFAKHVPALNDYATRLAGGEAGAPLTVLADFDLDRSRRLFFEWAPSFSLQAAPKALLRPLYRRLPRSFLVEDGRVLATYSGLPPQIAAGWPPSTGAIR